MTRGQIISSAALAILASLVLAGCDGTEPPQAPAGQSAAEAPASPATPEPPPPPETTGTFGPSSTAQGSGDDKNPIVQVLELNDWYRAALVERTLVRDARDLEALIRPICEGLKPCRVGVWYDKDNLPTQMPVTLAQFATQAFAFGRIYDGTENILWNCDLFPEFEAEKKCLPRDMT